MSKFLQSTVVLAAVLLNVSLPGQVLAEVEPPNDVKTAPSSGGCPESALPPGWVNVRDFGAVGDGETDDTEAIQKAIDNAFFEHPPGKPFSARMYNPRFGPGKSPTGVERYWGGVVYIPPGVYRTSKPLRMHYYLAIMGDPGNRPIIVSTAQAALVCWEGPWDETKVDWEKTGHIGMRKKICAEVTLKNLLIHGYGEYGIHTLGVAANRMTMDNCSIRAKKAAFVSTGFMMGAVFEKCYFYPAIWFLEEKGTEEFPRYNVSVIRDCTIGAGTAEPYPDWAMILKGCVQSMKIENICFENCAKGVLVDAYAVGVTISLDSIWNFDSRPKDADPEVIRVEAAEGISITNVMALDKPSKITLAKNNVKQVYLQNILCREIDANGVKVTAFNCPPIKNPGSGSVINGIRESETVVPK